MQFSVDTDRCVSCGLCLSDCLPRALGMDEEGHPYIKDERLCMHCHHCLALCPTGAISVDGHNPDASRRILNAWPQPSWRTSSRAAAPCASTGRKTWTRPCCSRCWT